MPTRGMVLRSIDKGLGRVTTDLSLTTGEMLSPLAFGLMCICTLIFCYLAVKAIVKTRG